MAHVIIFGNPVEGISVEGPFASEDDISEYTTDYQGDWWSTELGRPETPSQQERILCADAAAQQREALLAPEQLARVYAEQGQHPSWGKSEWMQAVVHDGVEQGYWEWVHERSQELAQALRQAPERQR